MKRVVLVASFAVGLAELFLASLPPVLLALLFFATLALPSLLLYFYSDYERQKRTAEVERFVPHAAMQLASLPASASCDLVVRQLAEGGFGVLSSEFALVRRRMDAGASFKAAVSRSEKAVGSLLYSRFASLLALSYRSGGDVSKAFKSFADTAFSLQNLRREAASALAFQKYTLIAAGGFIVPVILALLFNVVASLEADPSLVGVSLEKRNALTGAVVLGNYLYLSAFSVIASLFLAKMDSSVKKAVLYFSLLFFTSLAVFTLVRMM